MVENFKITAFTLKRKLNISVYLPNDYNESSRTYPTLYLLDGERFFHSLDNNRQEFDLPKLLDEENLNVIIVGIHTPTILEWRISELNPYYKLDSSQVDPEVGKVFSNYLDKELKEVLSQRYRISNENSYLICFNDAANQGIYSIYHQSNFKGAALFSPDFSKSDYEPILEDIFHNMKIGKRFYIFNGGLDGKNHKVERFKEKLDELKINNYYLNNNFESNTFNFQTKYIIDSINYLLKRD